MKATKTELEKLEVFRLSGRDANRITRECIQSALVLLMQTKPFEEISVTELVQQAGVSRTAYYHTYKSKEEVLSNMVHDVVNTIGAVVIQEQEPQRRNLLIFQETEKYADIFSLLLDAHFADQILCGLTDYCLAAIPEENLSERIRMEFWCGAFYNVLQYWIKQPNRVSAKEISECFQELYQNAFCGS